MSGVYKLKGVIQNYAWGGTEFIPKLLGAKPNVIKCAEYWLGAHNNATSTVFKGGNEIKLNALISKDIKANLGLNISEKFGCLPFLFKVLDVHDMLSIQVHPSKKEAEKGFKKENKLGIPLRASNRNYKDDNHKPEIMVALSEFWLLHGFLTEKKLIICLNSTPELSHLIADFKNEGYRGLYKKLMEESQEVTDAVLQPLIKRVLPLYKQGELDKNSPDYWAAKAYETFCDEGIIDKGIYSIYLFNIVQANIGEAVFQDAGIPHAYLEGQNMELMANSDNVLRGGLTPKHVDVPELLKHVEFQETIPNIMQGELQADGIECIYKSPAPDFELSQLVFSKKKSKYTNKSKTAIIYIVVNGKAKVQDSDKSIEIKKGEAIVVLAESNYSIEAEGDAILYKATAPI
ncbi:mannose-6-phosphate isomerase, class I [Urechidicola vernalis]|uniref:mannose-6-phosphate isomerase n=1 Tax=Urechidicola vernalis TaxID=3075600 RepID=A0ABU2Y5U3_9FLAO|nr:mannose-6-phosphate isomerase, class I [Urechidicola sp. P050]MDT0553052.1 mannose-6-phosphate isomerase, class I [Urechidicola sp. P050]